MFTLDATIDAVQNGKKQFVKTFVKNETMAEALNSFIDAQSEYTKSAGKAALDATTVVTGELTKMVQEATKFDFAKFGEGVTKAYKTAK